MTIESTEENVRPSCLGVRHLQTALLAAAMVLQVFTHKSTMRVIYYYMSRDDQHYGLLSYGYDRFHACYFWSLVIALIPAGELATRFGGKLLLTISFLVNVLISLAMPLIPNILKYENLGWYLLCLCFGLLGVSKSLVDPSMQNLIGQWIPLEEKGLFTTIIYSGNVLSVVLPQILTNYLELWLRWQYIYYVYGVLGAVWTMAYIFLGSASPEHSKIISKTELSYIQRSLRRVGKQQKYRTPYWKIMTSLPFWAVIVANCGHVCGFIILIILYMSSSRGMVTHPYLPLEVMYILSIPLAWMSDLIVRNNRLSVTKTRKLFNSIGLWVPTMILLFLAFSSLDETAVMFLYATAIGITAGHYTGFLMVYTDMSPNFSANLIAITRLFENFATLAVWNNIDFIVPGEPFFGMLLSGAGIFFFSNLFFVIFASAERQPWNEPGTKHIEDTEKAETKTDEL